MKKFIALVLTILTAFSLQTGFAIEEEVIPTESASDLYSVIIQPDGHAILGGKRNDGSVIYSYDLNHKTLKELVSPRDDDMVGRYVYGMSWDENSSSTVSLLYGGKTYDGKSPSYGTNNSKFIMISDDEVRPIFTDIHQTFAVYSNSHQIIYSYIFDVNEEYHAGIKCVTENQDEVWDIQMDRWITYTKILPYRAGVLCMGYYCADHSSSPQGVLTAIDEDGQITWSYTTEDFVEYVDCTILDDDSVVVVGYMQNSDEPEYPYIACFDQNDLKWKAIKDYGSGWLLSRAVCAIDNRILFVCSRRNRGVKLNNFWIIEYSSDGKFISEEEVSLENMYIVRKFYFQTYYDSLYLFISGKTELEDDITEYIILD